MNALHATVLSTQCKRYAEVIESFTEEVEHDEKLTNQERDYISVVLGHCSQLLNKLSDEIHNSNRHQ